MPIRYNRLFNLLKERNLTMYALRREKVIGTESLEKMRKAEKHIDTRTIERLCKYLNCQPGDIMEYVPDDETVERDKERGEDNASTSL